MLSSLRFSFEGLEIVDQLKQSLENTQTGYWQIRLVKAEKTNFDECYYIAVVQGLIVFSGVDKLSWKSLRETLEQFLPKLRSDLSQKALNQIQKKISIEKNFPLNRITVEMEKMKLLNYDELVTTLRTKILTDMDEYLFNGSGEAGFIPDSDLLMIAPIRGFEINSLLTESIKRGEEWTQIKPYLPSLSCPLIPNTEAIEKSNLAEKQKAQLLTMIRDGENVKTISYNLGTDQLEIAKKFALLIKKEIVKINFSNIDNETSTRTEIFIVDDSPIILKQFRQLVQTWGYKVNYADDPLIAIEKMLESPPNLIFLDINMPGITGFDLIKQIRRQEQLASIPLVLLTAERTIANQWRAQWANCKFLPKPASATEIPIFQTELKKILEETANMSIIE